MSELETILFTVDKDDTVRAGLPPLGHKDNYKEQAAILGKLKGVNKLAFSPEGKLYVVRGTDLYVGPMPSAQHTDWFSVAKRVGKVDWNQFKFIFFHPNGELYAVTNDGRLYRGPVPDNEYVSWIYRKATKIGSRLWETHYALFFDPEGILYAVTNDKRFVKRSPPTHANDNWLGTSITIGQGAWHELTHFMCFTPDGMLWIVDTVIGKICCGTAPEPGVGVYFNKILGVGYNQFKFLAMTKDKTIQKMLSFEFLPDLGSTISESLEVVKDERHDNRNSSVPLKHTFKVNKTIKESSEFTHEHGLTFEAGTEMTFKGGVPGIAEQGLKLSINMSTTHNWNFTKTNETETVFSSSIEVEVPGGKAIRIIASVRKAEMVIPYRAKVRTLFGYETTIEGTWRGVSHYNLSVLQEDI